MARLASIALPAKAGKIVFACALSSVCAVLILNAGAPGKPEASDVSLKESGTSGEARTPPVPKAVPEPSPYSVNSATVERTFAETAQRLGIDAGTTVALSHAFADEIDFTHDLRKGDTLSAVYDRPHEGAPPSTEPLAVRLTVGDDSHEVFLHRKLDGRAFYYSEDGTSTTPSFSRYPLSFTRISSEFSHRRLDPVTHRWQSHDGVDLAAPAGTPVHATAAGTVKFIGRQTGYGKVIVIQNPPPYSTTFAHLSRFAKGIRRGSKVHRDQVIAYVGETGWATGPHLHYEVHVDHVAKDPLTVALPHDDRLRGAEREHFAKEAHGLSALL
jgi:murein DD-endopeptidase MepM/ murein hydrolase activator NlpD